MVELVLLGQLSGPDSLGDASGPDRIPQDFIRVLHRLRRHVRVQRVGGNSRVQEALRKKMLNKMKVLVLFMSQFLSCIWTIIG